MRSICVCFQVSTRDCCARDTKVVVVCASVVVCRGDDDGTERKRGWRIVLP